MWWERYVAIPLCILIPLGFLFIIFSVIPANPVSGYGAGAGIQFHFASPEGVKQSRSSVILALSSVIPAWFWRGSHKVRQRSAWHIFGGHIIPLLSLRGPRTRSGGRSNPCFAFRLSSLPFVRGGCGWGRGIPSFAFRVVCMLLVVAMLSSQALAYDFPYDVDDDWPPADRAYFLYVHTDHLGGSQLMTEGSERSTHNGLRFIKGEVVQRVEYSPFGKERFVLNPELEEGPKFTGQTQDMEDGLYYYNARYYDPVLGRFIQPDPVVFSDPRNPQTLNAYTYALNNPIKYIDPTGHFNEGPDDDDVGGGEEADLLGPDPVEQAYSDNGDALLAEADRVLREADRVSRELGDAADRLGREGLTGGGTAGDRFHFTGIDRDLDGDVDVIDRVIENEMSGQPTFNFNLDGAGEKNYSVNKIQLATGLLAISAGLSMLAIGGGMVALGLGEISTGHPAFMFAGFHTVGGSAPFFGVGIFSIQIGIKIIRESKEQNYRK